MPEFTMRAGQVPGSGASTGARGGVLFAQLAGHGDAIATAEADTAE